MIDLYDPKSSNPANVLRKIATEIDYLTDLSGYRPNTAWLRKAADEIDLLNCILKQYINNVMCDDHIVGVRCLSYGDFSREEQDALDAVAFKAVAEDGGNGFLEKCIALEIADRKTKP